MNDPVVEKIAQVVLSRLKLIGTDAGYNYTPSKVVRPSKVSVSPEHLLVVLGQGDPEPDEENSVEGNPYRTAWVAPFYIALWIKPSDDDNEPLDAQVNRFAADATRAVSTFIVGQDWANFENNANDARWGQSERFKEEKDAYVGVTLLLLVTLRHDHSNPYTQG